MGKWGREKERSDFPPKLLGFFVRFCFIAAFISYWSKSPSPISFYHFWNLRIFRVGFFFSDLVNSPELNSSSRVFSRVKFFERSDPSEILRFFGSFSVKFISLDWGFCLFFVSSIGVPDSNIKIGAFDCWFRVLLRYSAPFGKLGSLYWVFSPLHLAFSRDFNYPR